MDVHVGCRWPVLFPSCPVFARRSVWVTPASRAELGKRARLVRFLEGLVLVMGKEYYYVPVLFGFFL